MNINDLPEDCLRVIFSNLKIVDKFRCFNVCKYWKDLLDDMLLHQKVFSPRSIFNIKWGDYNSADGMEDNDQNEAYRDTVFFNSNMVQSIIRKCPNTEVFDLWDFLDYETIIENNFTDEELKLLSLNCPNLKHINLGGAFDSITEVGLQNLIRNCRKLEYLNINECRRITGESLSEITDAIRVFKARDCDDLMASSVVDMLKYVGKCLRKLKFGVFETSTQRVEGYSRVLRYICKKCINLNSLYFGIALEGKELGLKSIGKLTQLRALHLHTDAISLTDAALYNVMQGCSNLICFKLYREHNSNNYHSLSDLSLQNLSNKCPFIEVLQLTSCTRITDQTIQTFNKFKKLKSLSLNTCPNIGNAVGEVFRTHSKHIKFVMLHFCQNVTIDSLNVLKDVAKSRPNEDIYYEFHQPNFEREPNFPDNLKHACFKVKPDE